VQPAYAERFGAASAHLSRRSEAKGGMLKISQRSTLNAVRPALNVQLREAESRASIDPGSALPALRPPEAGASSGRPM